jgi:hypothetical protein
MLQLTLSFEQMQILKTFVFKQEPFGLESFCLKFIIDFQIPYQRKLILDLGHEKVVACDVTFGTKDKNIFSPISLGCFIFT